MKIPWRINDLIDLEYLLHADENPTDKYDMEQHHRRDREIYLRYIQPALDKNTSPDASRRTLIKRWLDHRRVNMAPAADDQVILPGALFAETLKIMRFGAAVAGICTGFTLALSLLAYSGTHPVNISVLFGLLVLVQVVLIFFSGGMLTLRLFKADIRPTSMGYAMLCRLLARLVEKFTNRVKNRFPAHQRDSIHAATGLIIGKNRIYGSLFIWPLFIILQIFAVGCNTGVLAGILLRVLTTDLAFGWQSTIQFSSHAVYLMVKAISLPWSFLLPAGMAHPSLAQIQGSRMVLKEGIYQLTTPALVSWWPFLCLAIVFYALLPRLVLLAVGRFAQNRALGRLRFTHAACDQLARRMKTPLLTTRAIEPDDQKNCIGQVSPGLNGQTPARSKTDGENVDVLALIPTEILEQSTDDVLFAGIKTCTGLTVRAVVPVSFDPKEIDMLAQRLCPEREDGNLPGLFILQEAWQPPIKETTRFIHRLRNILGPKTFILIGLIGKPGADTLFTPVKKENQQVWEHKINAVGDPYMQVQVIGGRHE